MSRTRKGFLVVTIALILATSSFVALNLLQIAKASPNPIVIPDPTEIVIPYCNIGDVAICVQNFTDLYGFQFKIWWLKDAVNLTGYEWKPYPPEWAGLTLTFGPSYEENATHKSAMFGIVAMLPAPPFSYAGKWPFIDLYWHCIMPNVDSPLIFDRVYTYLVDIDGIKIPIEAIIDGLVINPPSTVYRYKAKFEYGWQSEVVGTHFLSLNVPVETFTITHVNVYNPNDFYVPVTKYFVKVWPEPKEYVMVSNCNAYILPGDFAGRTCHMHIDVPERKGFEIDAEDVLMWPPDPTNPIKWLISESFWKGFVIIECPYELNVVAVYDKVGVDVVNKITFHMEWPTCEPSTYHPVPPGPDLKYNTLYEITVVVPEDEPIDLEGIVSGSDWFALFSNDTEIEIIDTQIWFDFLQCVNRERIQFILRPPISKWYEFLDYMFPPSDHPYEGWKWPDWFKPCITLEKIKKIRSYPSIDNHTLWETFWSWGDANHDGYIDYKDMKMIADNFGWTGPPGENPADVNKDGVVNMYDLAICASNVGKDIWTHVGITPLEQWGPLEQIRDPEKMVRQNINSTLIEIGVPPDIASAIVNQLRIEIIELDVAEGVGTSIDVEYIEPEFIEPPPP